MDPYADSRYKYRADQDWIDPSRQIVSQRRGSDTEYDVRSPGQYHRDARPKPSYYGRDFHSVEQGMSSSFTGPAHPFENPSVWEKRPNPYVGNVKDDYDYYKYNRPQERDRASTRYSSAERAGIQPHQTKREYQVHLRDLASKNLCRANEVCQARAGFDDKYPYAYENHEAKINHQHVAWEERGKNLRKKIMTHEGTINIQDTLASGLKPMGTRRTKKAKK